MGCIGVFSFSFFFPQILPVGKVETGVRISAVSLILKLNRVDGGVGGGIQDTDSIKSKVYQALQKRHTCLLVLFWSAFHRIIAASARWSVASKATGLYGGICTWWKSCISDAVRVESHLLLAAQHFLTSSSNKLPHQCPSCVNRGGK